MGTLTHRSIRPRAWLLGAALLLVTAAVMPGASAQAPRAGGTLVIGSQFDVPTLDPHRTTAITVAGLSSLLFDTLLTPDYDLRTVGAGLARRWESSADGTTYTFHLRDDVTFHSGRRFTSTDVKWSFERILDPKTGSPHKWRLGDVAAIETPNETTVVLRLKGRHAELLVQLASPFVAIVDREAVEKHGPKFGSAGPAGTGPFTFQEWVLNDHMTFKRFSQYRWGPAFFMNRGPAHLDEVVFRIIPEYQTMLFEAERGGVHAFRGVRSADVERLRRARGLGVLEANPSQQTHYLGFKVTRPGVSDVNVRKAISAALNREALAKAVTHGLAGAAKGIFLPGVSDYWAGQESIFPKHDAVGARALLDAAGWKPGADGIRVKDGHRLRLTLLGMLGTVEEHEELHPLLQAQLKDVGVDIEVKLMAVPAFFATLGKQDYDLWTLATPYASVFELLRFWYSSKNIPSPNRTMWNDPRTDAELLAAQSAASAEARARALQDVQRIAAEHHLLVPLWHEVLRVPTRAEVKGFRPHGVYATGYYKFLDVWLER